MRSKCEFPDVLRMFFKGVGVTLSLILDPARDRTSKNVKKFCHQIGNTLRILEENTQWDNQTDLYVGMFKDSIRK